MSVHEPRLPVLVPDADLPPPAPLPAAVAGWFAARGWTPHPHQLRMLAAADAGLPVLLIAPTGAGKTLGGFLPGLARAAAGEVAGRLDTIYISPLKALAADIARNLEQPIAEMGLGLQVGVRTGDTDQRTRERQRRSPPELLLTTPESLALMLSYADAPRIFGRLATVIVDEVHAIAGTKRGDLLALGLARLKSLSPGLRVVGLSATVADEEAVRRWVDPRAVIVRGREAAQAEVSLLIPEGERVPWAGHLARHAMAGVYQAIRDHGTTLVFVNTRAQAELVFQELWHLNEDGLAIALHHGSLAAEQRRKVEAAMAEGRLRAVVATSSLDLGIDWAAVDLVMQIGAPKGVSRLVQRIGRANHRLDLASKAILVPANRFEVLECRAALEAVAEGELDGEPPRPGALDVLAQHVLGTACMAPFDADALYAEVTGSAPYAALDRPSFDAVVDFVATGGYALRAYDRFRRIEQDETGRWRVAGPVAARQYRMNVGTIVEMPMLNVRLTRPGGRGMGGRMLGRIEEWFVQGLVPGDSFVFAGELLVYEALRETDVLVSRGRGGDPRIPSYGGGRFPISASLARRVRGMLADPAHRDLLPPAVAEWLAMQELRSELPGADGLLVETFPRGGRWFLIAYGFAGRNAHQTLGMLLTRRMERMGFRPMGFVANDYAIAIWSLDAPERIDALFGQDMMGEDLEAWMAESSMLRRTFRNVAVIAGLIEQRHPGREKTGRQVTFSSDLIYDVLRRHQPDHVLLKATWADAAGGLTDLGRLNDMLVAVQGRILHRPLARVSPLAVPLLLEVGRESVPGQADDDLLGEAAALIEDATRG
ncbi:ligase-associated DNA damage response DEXH box helicase [Tistrella mobilis]|uniref:ligase-associated DNA damage response DEXH box helicase n=1 Tax=Tistrella mobilis TaxID=171437 RepID=UPI003557ABBD